MPLQHINDRVLKRMQPARRPRRDRGRCSAGCGRRSRTWRCGRRSSSASPARPTPSSRNCGSSSRDAKFERVGVFPYSLEPGTPAEKLDGHLPEEVKQARVDRAHGGAAAGRVRLGAGAGRQGASTVIIDGPDPEFANHFRGRTYADCAGHRLRRPREGQEPAAGRLRAGEGDRGRRLRPRRPRRRQAVVTWAVSPLAAGACPAPSRRRRSRSRTPTLPPPAAPRRPSPAPGPRTACSSSISGLPSIPFGIGAGGGFGPTTSGRPAT